MTNARQQPITTRRYARSTITHDDAFAELARHARVAEIPCPSCWIGPSDEATAAVSRFAGEYGYDVTPACCPTCGVESVEWGLVVEMDAVLAGLLRWTRLEEAVHASDSSAA